ncbi:plant UBX domain-containing protein 8-like [Rutidosis leptorrhynchoides]|uniref:plant UBX domain-containing protein 8-like n=1 Tax=Rutidosis leptorrhynchoides TaxID=125765 RepID=UPI003A99D124
METTLDQQSIETFMSITGSSEPVAIQKLTEHGGNLNQAVNSHFTQGDTNIHETNVAAQQEDLMDIDEPIVGPSDDITDTLQRNVSETRGAQIVDDDDARVTPSAPAIDHLPEVGIEEEMIKAAIEASKREAEISQTVNADLPLQLQSQLDDPEINDAGHASLKQEKTSRELESEAGPSETGAEVEEGATLALSSNGRLTEDAADEQPLVRHRSRRRSSRIMRQQLDVGPTQHDEWGGISSEEHDEAVMLEAAMFGGVPEGAAAYHVPYATGGPYTRSTPRPPSPSLTAQRLIREQQDDEYLEALQADREKELLEQAEEIKKEQEAQRKLEQEQEIERQLAVKEVSLSPEPASDDENAVTLLVRMPDGSRRGRRFLRTDKLQYLFDFIDVGRVVKPCTYRLVRPFPRRAFGDGESNLTLNELDLTNKQEALFLELI